MTKKDYVVIAEALADAANAARKLPQSAGLLTVAELYQKKIEKYLADDNPRFDPEKFRKYTVRFMSFLR